MSKPRAQQLIDRYEQNKANRTNFESYWQSLHDYFYIEAADVNRTYYPGTELTSDFLFDATTLESADVLASGFMNYLTPPTSKWFQLRHRNPKLKDNHKVNVFFDELVEEVTYTLNRSNFYDQKFNDYKASGVYGTSITIAEEDDDTDVRFYSIPVKQAIIIDDGQGKVSEYFIEFEYTALQAADKFGAKNLSAEMQQELIEDNPKNEKHKFLMYIGKRSMRDIRKSDSKNLPIEGSWIDCKGKVIVKESGYNEWPAFTHRFEKRPFIPWGFSPAMKALPFARIANAIAKTNLRAMMKHTDPAIAIPDNAFIMPFNANPRAVNYYNKAKMDGSKDVFEFGNYGDPNAGLTALQYYTTQIKQVMFNDVFLAFNNIDKQMNNPEIMERINEKMTILGSAVGREISDRINPSIIRTIGILHRKGRLPPFPDEILEDPTYEIDSISQLAQAQRRSELNALMTGLNLVGQMAQYVPEVLDGINADKTRSEIWKILGAPDVVLRDAAEVEAIREAKAKAAQQQMQLQMAQQAAEVISKGADGQKKLSEAAA